MILFVCAVLAVLWFLASCTELAPKVVLDALYFVFMGTILFDFVRTERAMARLWRETSEKHCERMEALTERAS